MTTSDWKKTLQQLKNKPNKLKKYTKHNKPKDRPTGMTKRRCSRCGRYGGQVKKYGLEFCRCCFREIATHIGFKKYS